MTHFDLGILAIRYIELNSILNVRVLKKLVQRVKNGPFILGSRRWARTSDQQD
jgi:hypothetical protein